MIVEYIEAAMAEDRYEIIEDEEPYYGEVPGLAGVRATGRTLLPILTGGRSASICSLDDPETGRDHKGRLAQA